MKKDEKLTEDELFIIWKLLYLYYPDKIEQIFSKLLSYKS